MVERINEGDEFLGKMVQVNNVILPPWAKGRHHFISMNYLALEHPRVKSEINNWIDLIFGDKQQCHECYNLFKSLTSEVIILIFNRNT